MPLDKPTANQSNEMCDAALSDNSPNTVSAVVYSSFREDLLFSSFVNVTSEAAILAVNEKHGLADWSGFQAD